MLPAGPAHHPSAPPSDDNPPWNSDDKHDFAEQAYSPPSPMSHYPGSLNQLVQFLSDISLTPDSCMQRNGIPMLYERAASQLPTLYVCPVEKVIGSVPLMPCYLKGNLHNTVPHSLWHAVPAGAAADSRPDSRTGSRLFQGQYLDVAPWESVPQEDLSGGC